MHSSEKKEGANATLERNISSVFFHKATEVVNKANVIQKIFDYNEIRRDAMKKYFTNEEVKAIGPRIRKLLDENGISVAEAAGELGIEVSYYYRMLKGTRPMTIDNLIAHCMYLDVSLGYLLAGDESLYWDDKNNVVPGEIEILIEKVVSSIENLDAHRRAEKAAKLGHRFSEMIEKMN